MVLLIFSQKKAQTKNTKGTEDFFCALRLLCSAFVPFCGSSCSVDLQRVAEAAHVQHAVDDVFDGPAWAALHQRLVQLVTSRHTIEMLVHSFRCVLLAAHRVKELDGIAARGADAYLAKANLAQQAFQATCGE